MQLGPRPYSDTAHDSHHGISNLSFYDNIPANHNHGVAHLAQDFCRASDDDDCLGGVTRLQFDISPKNHNRIPVDTLLNRIQIGSGIRRGSSGRSWGVSIFCQSSIGGSVIREGWLRSRHGLLSADGRRADQKASEENE